MSSNHFKKPGVKKITYKRKDGKFLEIWHLVDGKIAIMELKSGQ